MGLFPGGGLPPAILAVAIGTPLPPIFHSSDSLLSSRAECCERSDKDRAAESRDLSSCANFSQQSAPGDLHYANFSQRFARGAATTCLPPRLRAIMRLSAQ